MRPRRVAASVTLTVALASAIGVASAGAQQSTAYVPIQQGFRPVVLGGASMAAILSDSATVSAGRLSTGARFFGPASGADPSGRPTAVQPQASVGVVFLPPPEPSRGSGGEAHATTTAGAPGWQSDASVSWYGPGFYGQVTACGQTLTTTLVGVANRTLPCGTLVTFRNPANGRTLTVPVVDRGPYVSGRQWDLTGGLCLALDHCYTGPIDWRPGG